PKATDTSMSSRTDTCLSFPLTFGCRSTPSRSSSSISASKLLHPPPLKPLTGKVSLRDTGRCGRLRRAGGGGCGVAYVTPLYGGSAEQVDYRLGLAQHGCGDSAQFAYHADARERPLRWIGEGLDAFGVEGLRAGAELTEGQFEAARRLIRGEHPGTGEQLVAPKVAVAPEAKVPLGPLVAAGTLA